VTVNPEHCLKANPTADGKKGTILDEVVLVKPENKGIKNVFVYLLVEPDSPPLPVHPKLQKFDHEVAMDQPACMFWPRAVAIREGQTLVVKNSSPVDHSIKWDGDQVSNQGNVVIKPGASHAIKGLKAQKLPIPLSCSLHGWMKGRLGVFNHPCFAI